MVDKLESFGNALGVCFGIVICFVAVVDIGVDCFVCSWEHSLELLFQNRFNLLHVVSVFNYNNEEENNQREGVVKDTNDCYKIINSS